MTGHSRRSSQRGWPQKPISGCVPNRMRRVFAVADKVDGTEKPPKLRIVQPSPKDRYVTCVPLVPLRVAAGAFSNPQRVEDENWKWVAIKTKHRLHPGMFVAQVVGKSMEPAIPDGSYCL